MGTIFQLQRPEREVWGIVMVQGVEWECAHFVPLLQRIPTATTATLAPFISSDLFMKVFKDYTKRLNFHSVQTSLCWKMSFLSRVRRELKEPSNKKQDESWVSSTENHYSEYSDEECAAVPRQMYSRQKESHVSCCGQWLVPVVTAPCCIACSHL